MAQHQVDQDSDQFRSEIHALDTHPFDINQPFDLEEFDYESLDLPSLNLDEPYGDPLVSYDPSSGIFGNQPARYEEAICPTNYPSDPSSSQMDLLSLSYLTFEETPRSSITASTKAQEAPEDRSRSSFDRVTTNVLKTWWLANSNNPYPTDEEKEALQERTGLTKGQINTWLANARRRAKRASRSQRDQPSLSDAFSRSESRGRQQSLVNSHTSSRTSSKLRPVTSRQSSRSDSDTSTTSRRSLKDRRRRQASILTGREANDSNIFQCTFCTDSFPTKHDWVRHEKSLHLSLEKWICAPLGPTFISTTNIEQCVYCLLPMPDAEHIESHNYAACAQKDISARTFTRKDHLSQHLKLFHRVPLLPSMEAWKSAPDVIHSRCGFCASETLFTTWQGRTDHLAAHFREGAKMKDWQGDWGFDTEVVIQVTCAMPPAFIGFELKTPNPFKAGTGDIEISDQMDRGVAGLEAQGMRTRGRVSACWDVMPKMLGRWVREEIDAGKGGSLTPDVLKRKARWLLYGDDDDPWSQTPADNEDWMRLFREAHGLIEGDIDHLVKLGANTLTLMGADFPIEKAGIEAN